MAPPGTRAVVYEALAGRTSWGTRGVDGWYCGPAFDHYSNMRFYIPETKAYRITASYDLFSQYCQLLTLSDQQQNREVAKERIKSVQRLKNRPKKAAIKDLKKTIDAMINGGTLPTSEGEKTATEGVGPPATTVTTSTNPTNPHVLRDKPRTHLKQTRRNTPAAVPPICSHRTSTDEEITEVAWRRELTTADGRAKQQSHPAAPTQHNHTSGD